MGIAVKGINIPILGLPTFRTEDQFIPSIKDQVIAQIGGGSIPQEIIIACKNKRRRVCGYLAEGVKLKAESNWKPITDNGVISQFQKGLSTVDSLTQLGIGGETKQGGSSAGTTIQQPWAERKFWAGSKPFTLDFNFNFVAEKDAQYDVFMPAQALLSFCYPREVANLKSAEALKSAGGQVISSDKNTKGGQNLAKAVSEAAKTYAIPGPSLMYGSDREKEKGDNGDAVTISVGNMFAFGACYLKSVQIEFSPNIDWTGYPVWCKCTISAEAMDANYCNEDGSFLVGQFNNNQAALSNVMQALSDTIEQSAQDMANIAKKTMNAIGINMHGFGGA